MSSDALRDITAVEIRKSVKNNPARIHVSLDKRKFLTDAP
jgi:hypothetical protein